MKHCKIYIFTFSFLLNALLLKSQDTLNQVLNLDKCIQFALKNNVEVQQYDLLNNKAELLNKNARNQYLPQIEGGVRNNYNWGLFIDPATNIISTQNVQIWGMGVGADWTLFNGGYNYYNIKQSDELQKAAKADYDFKKNEIRLNVTAAYYQLLYCYEQLKIAQSQKAQNSNYYNLIKSNVEQGILHKRELLRMESQLAVNDVAIVEAENAVLRYNLLLRQSMGIPGGKTIQIDSTVSDKMNEFLYVMSDDSICSRARCFLPEILKAKSALEASRFGLKVAGSYRYPVFFVSTGIQTKSSTLILMPQRNQFKQNMSEFFTFNLTVPIFNRFQTLNSISLSRLDISYREKEVKRVSLEADKKIQSAHLDLNLAHKKFWAVHKQLKLQEAQYILDEKSYLNGIIAYTDYYYALSLYNQMRIQLLQAQYDYYFKKEVLTFYEGNIIKE